MFELPTLFRCMFDASDSLAISAIWGHAIGNDLGPFSTLSGQADKLRSAGKFERRRGLGGRGEEKGGVRRGISGP